jgi:hypothetical protein
MKVRVLYLLQGHGLRVVMDGELGEGLIKSLMRNGAGRLKVAEIGLFPLFLLLCFRFLDFLFNGLIG